MIDRIQLLREQVVDELVVARTSSRRDYMMALMMFADSERPTVLSSAFLRRRHLKSRLRELLKESHMSFPRLVSTMAVLALLMAGVTVATVRALPLDLTAIAQGRSAARLEIRLAENAFTPGLVEAVQRGSGQRVYLHAMALATTADISSVRVIDNGNSIFSIEVTFSRPAAARMASGTGAHLGRPLAIVLDGQVISVATVRAQISDTALHWALQRRGGPVARDPAGNLLRLRRMVSGTTWCCRSRSIKSASLHTRGDGGADRRQCAS